MAVKVVHVSDISGKEADEQSLGRLVVHEHPEYADLPVTLEVLPEEVDIVAKRVTRAGTAALHAVVRHTAPSMVRRRSTWQ